MKGVARALMPRLHEGREYINESRTLTAELRQELRMGVNGVPGFYCHPSDIDLVLVILQIAYPFMTLALISYGLWL